MYVTITKINAILTTQFNKQSATVTSLPLSCSKLSPAA